MDSILHNGTFSASQMRKSKLACDLPWREKMREANNRKRYLFNGKELDTETNLYYYGARYFEPNIAMWYDADPLTEKYPFTSSYVYCNGNSVKYVDPDGKGPFDNENIRQAKNYAEKVDGVYQEWTNKDGYQSASVQTCSVTTNDEGTYEIEVTATVFQGTQSNQHNPVWNMAEAFEDATGIGKEGHSDCANEGKGFSVDEFRGMANALECFSDVSDVIGTGFLATGVGAEAAPAFYMIGTISGAAGDVINAGVDMYEGNWSDAFTRVGNSAASYFFGKKIKAPDTKTESYLQKGLDKVTDACTENQMSQ